MHASGCVCMSKILTLSLRIIYGVCVCVCVCISSSRRAWSLSPRSGCVAGPLSASAAGFSV
uniref:Uncharacterized protein n=1 Tax=Anguilla anguilla TaxID=7936 RepID=A0A0E9XML3_ANGAN